jgi:hypothetical protein
VPGLMGSSASSKTTIMSVCTFGSLPFCDRDARRERLPSQVSPSSTSKQSCRAMTIREEEDDDGDAHVYETPADRLNEDGPRRNPGSRGLVIRVSTPTLLLGIIAVLWFSGNLDSLLARVNAAKLTHACVNASSSFADSLHCVIYKSEATQTDGALATPAAQDPDQTHAASGTAGAAPSGTGTSSTNVAGGSISTYPGPVPALAAGRWSGVKPSVIAFGADGGNIVTKIVWSAWTPIRAVGQGESIIESCVPSCAAGISKTVATTVTLSAPDDNVFERLDEARDGTTSTYRYIGGPWPLAAS